MPPLELDPRLALLPAEELAALLIAVSEARQDAAANDAAGEVIVTGKRYYWQLTSSAEPLEPTSTTVLKIGPTTSELLSPPLSSFGYAL